MEAALKTTSKTEAAPLKLNPQAFLDDLWALNGASCDDFLVDDLLDFSNEDGLAEKHEEQDKIFISVSPKEENREGGKSNQSVNYDFGSVTDSEIGVQADDMESLEWLSHFVEESFSEILPSYPAGIVPENPAIVTGEKNLKVKPPVSTTDTCFKSPFPAKARSKRSRYGAGAWSLRSPSSLTESSTSSSSSSSSSMPNPNPWLLYTNPVCYSLQPFEPFYAKPVLKKPKKKLAGEANSGRGYCAQQPRRCSHCGVQKTPQWRAGPLGVKTLCNACGVRFKSGRLLPEYRPACSPTFSTELHSNHHRKVLEMRKKNETEPGLQEAGLTVPGF